MKDGALRLEPGSVHQDVRLNRVVSDYLVVDDDVFAGGTGRRLDQGIGVQMAKLDRRRAWLLRFVDLFDAT